MLITPSIKEHQLDTNQLRHQLGMKQWDVESTFELDSKGANIPIGPNGPRFKLIYLVDIGYKG